MATPYTVVVDLALPGTTYVRLSQFAAAVAQRLPGAQVVCDCERSDPILVTVRVDVEDNDSVRRN